MNLPTHLSYTSISAYLTCPRSWYYRYVVRPEVRTNYRLVFGRAFHGVVEALLAGVFGSLDQLLEEWPHCFGEAIGGEHDVDWEATTERDALGLGERMLRAAYPTFAELVLAYDGDRPLLEQCVEWTVEGVPPVIGYIDAQLAGHPTLPADFKTSESRWPEGKAANDLQATIYLAALAQAGQRREALRYYVVTKARTPVVQVVDARRTPADFVWVAGLVRETWLGISCGYFPPTDPASWKCDPRYCEYFRYCRGGEVCREEFRGTP